MSFNLFDFSKNTVGSSISPLMGKSPLAPQPTQVKGATGGGMKPPTINRQPLPQTPKIQPSRTPPGMFNGLIPRAKAGGIYDDVDLENLKMFQEMGIPDDEAISLVDEKKRSREEAKPTPQPITTDVPKEEPKKGILSKIEGIGAGFVNPLVEVSKFSERYLEPSNWFKSKEEVDKNVAKVEKQLRPLLQEEGAQDMPGFNAGKFAGEMTALSVMPTTQINGALAKLSEQYGAKIVPKAVEALFKSNPVKLKAAQSFLSGIVPAIGFQAASTGEVDAGTTATIAALNPILNVAKSIPGIRNITGRSEILNAGKIADKQALMTPTGKIISDKSTLDEAARRIAGGSPEQAKKTIEAVSSIKTKGIKTGEQLHKTLDDTVKKLSKVQEGVLSIDKKAYTPNETIKTSIFKDEVRKVNPIANALEDLNTPAIMEKVSPDDAVKVAYYAKKFAKEGLTKLEMNDVAKIYGQQFETFRGLTAVASKAGFENTRTGIKEVIRSVGTPSPVSQELDRRMANAIATRDVVKEMNNKVAEAQSKVTTRFGEQIGRAITNMLDKSTFGVLRGVARTLGGSGEVKEGTMSAIEISKQVTKDLATIKKLSSLLDEVNSASEAMKIIKQFSTGLKTTTIGNITK